MTPRRAEIPANGTMRRARGFTILELVLAAGLGTVIVLAILGLMSAMRSTELRTRGINTGIVDLNRIHTVATRALSQIVVLPPAKSKKKDTSSAGTDPLPTNADAIGADGASKDSDQRPPRILLESDTLNAGQQRLEVLVSEPPILGGADGRGLQGSRGTWFSKQRGAFELVPRGKPEEGNDLYWVVYPLLEGDASASGSTKPDGAADAVPVLSGIPIIGDKFTNRADTPKASTDDAPMNDQVTDASGATARLLIAERITRLNWRMVKSNEGGQIEPFVEGRVVTQNELPAYFEADIELASGHKTVWMFEVGWVTEAAAKDTATNRLGDRDPKNPDGKPGSDSPASASGFTSGSSFSSGGGTGGSKSPAMGGRSRGTSQPTETERSNSGGGK